MKYEFYFPWIKVNKTCPIEFCNHHPKEQQHHHHHHHHHQQQEQFGQKKHRKRCFLPSLKTVFPFILIISVIVNHRLLSLMVRMVNDNNDYNYNFNNNNNKNSTSGSSSTTTTTSGIIDDSPQYYNGGGGGGGSTYDADLDLLNFPWCEDFPREGPEKDLGFQALYLIDAISSSSSSSLTFTGDDAATTPGHSIKILCVLWFDAAAAAAATTTNMMNDIDVDSIYAAFEVYGHRCDQFITATTTTIADQLINDNNNNNNNKKKKFKFKIINENNQNIILSNMKQQQQQHQQQSKEDEILLVPILSSSSSSSSSSSIVNEEWENLLRLLRFVQNLKQQNNNNANVNVNVNVNNNDNNDSFDFVHIATKQTLVIEENLRQYLSILLNENQKYDKYNSKKYVFPLYVGGPALFQNDPTRRYCSPGAGYSLNMDAINILLESSSDCTNKYNNDDNNNNNNQNGYKTMTVHERLADCLYDSGNIAGGSPIICQNTMDGLKLRYLEYGPDYMGNYESHKAPPDSPIPYYELQKYHDITIQNVLGGISPNMIGIHMVDGNQPLPFTTTMTTNTIPIAMRRFRAIIDKSCIEIWKKRLPHGALDEHGNPGYVHDPTYLKKHPLPFNFLHRRNHPDDKFAPCEPEMGSSVEGEKGYEGLKKIQVYDINNNDNDNDNDDNNKKKTNKHRLLCIIYTHSGNHESRVRAIAETYAPHCDGFMAASNQTDKSIGAVHILHDGPELYSNMWLKVRGIWSYVYDNYLDDYDFFHIGGDDMYVIPENLKYLFLTGTVDGSWEKQLIDTDNFPLYLGPPMPDFGKARLRFCGGGGGYTLNRMALRTFIEDVFLHKDCGPYFVTSQEDRFMGHCLRISNVECSNCQDEFGEERYHGMSVDFHVKWEKGKANFWNADQLKRFHKIESPERMAQVSKYSISFHLKGSKPYHFVDNGIRRYHAIVYDLCK